MSKPPIDVFLVMGAVAFPAMWLAFYFVLRWLGVSELLWRRALSLTVIMFGVDLLVNIVFFTLGMKHVLGVGHVMTMALFVFLTRNMLAYKPWQAIVIPFGVYLFGYGLFFVLIKVLFL